MLRSWPVPRCVHVASEWGELWVVKPVIQTHTSNTRCCAGDRIACLSINVSDVTEFADVASCRAIYLDVYMDLTEDFIWVKRQYHTKPLMNWRIEQRALSLNRNGQILGFIRFGF